MRRKLKPSGMTIIGVYRYGYKIIPSSMQFTREQLLHLRVIGMRGGMNVPPDREEEYRFLEKHKLTLEERISAMRLPIMEDPLCAL